MQAQTAKADNLSRNSDWEDYKMRYEQKIFINNRSIAQFSENIDHVGPTLRTRFIAGIKKLKDKNETLQQKMEDYKREHHIA